MNSVTLEIEALKAVALFSADNKDIRRYLEGVRVVFKDGLCEIVATCGHTLGYLKKSTDEMTGEGAVTIPISVLKNIKQNKGYALLAKRAEGVWSLKAEGIEATFNPVEGQYYPDYHRVIPKQTTGEAAWYDPEYLMRVVKAAKILGNRKGLVLPSYNGEAGGVFGCADPRFKAIIMPLRSDCSVPTSAEQE